MTLPTNYFPLLSCCKHNKMSIQKHAPLPHTHA